MLIFELNYNISKINNNSLGLAYLTIIKHYDWRFFTKKIGWSLRL